VITTLPDDNRHNERQDEKYTDIALGNVEVLSPSNATINNASTSPADLILNNNQCLDERAIYIHGVWTNRMQAIEQAERIDLSLSSDKKISIFVFLWESTIRISPIGWDRAKNNANAAGH